jgi:hypothetical protein
MNYANNKTSTYVNLNCDYCKNVLISNKEIINAPCYNDFDNSFYCEDCIELVQENDRRFLEAEARQEGYFNRVLGGIHPDDNYLFIHREREYKYEGNCEDCGEYGYLSDKTCQCCYDKMDDIDDEIDRQLERATDIYTGDAGLDIDNYLFIHRGNKYRYEETHNCSNCGVNEPLSGYMCKSCLDYIDDEYEIMMSNKDS